MKQYRQFQTFLISDFQTDKWQHPVHKHNHYELIYIWHGNGMHYINENAIAYTAGNVFFIGPDEQHYFEIQELTRFTFIKFTDHYIHQSNSDQLFGMHQLEYLIKSRETHLSAFRLNPADSESARAIVNVILSLRNDLFSNDPLIWFQVLSFAVLLQRNMPELRHTLTRSKDMQALFCYIHKHIYEPEKLKSAVIAKHFNTTPDYIGPYFKRNSGGTMRDYIKTYRKSLIEKRIASGNYSLKQVAAEFGLTDESHARKILN